MFKKALAHQSNATPIRSSARRQLVAAVLGQYPSCLGPGATDDGHNEKELGKLLVPEGVRMGSYETSAGIEGTMYFDSEGDPLWMTFGRNSKEYIPTLSLLALPLPQPPLPILQIHHPIPPPLLTGAPLFVPALRNLSRLWYIPDVPEGGIVAFAISEKNDLDVSYVGIGRVVAKGGVRGAVERRLQKLRSDADVDEGKFCEVLCIRDDHLWEISSKPTLPTFPLPIPRNALAPPPQPEAGPSSSPVSAVVDTVAEMTISDPPSKAPSNLSPSDISTLLSLALLQTLSPESSPSPSFPIPASQLYSGFILPNRPAYIPKDQRDDVVIAKSEWKKLAKWMKEASKEGLIKIKDSKGEITVQSCDVNHPSIQGHSAFVTIAEDDAKAAKRAAREAASAGGGDGLVAGKGKRRELGIEELWKPGPGAASFWEAAGVDKASLNPAHTIRTLLDDYLVKRKLVDDRDHRLVKLDDELGRAVGAKNPAGQVMARDEILRKLRAGVTWSVAIGGTVKKGPLQPITMAVKTRQGRKTVTIVTGLETFGVDIEEFAEELRKLCAGSASIQPLTGSSPKLNLQEIMVQGPQIKVITEALVEKGIPKRWIKEVDGGKKK